MSFVIYVISIVPEFNPVIIPWLSIVARLISDEVQGVFILGIPEPINCIVLFSQTSN